MFEPDFGKQWVNEGGFSHTKGSKIENFSRRRKPWLRLLVPFLKNLHTNSQLMLIGPVKGGDQGAMVPHVFTKKSYF